MIRRFDFQDAEELARVYRDAVHTIGPQAYTQRQVEAWAVYPDDIEEFRSRLSRGLTLVAEEEGRIIAFGQLEPDDHLAFLYCAGNRCRRGVGSAIYQVLEAHAFQKGISQIHTEASRISRPFFTKHGYSLIEVEHVNRFGVEFERFRMVKSKPGNYPGNQMTLSYRPATPEDAQACVDIRGKTRENSFSIDQLKAVGVTPESWRNGIADGSFPGYVCLAEGSIIGYCFGDRPTGEVIVLAVLPEWEGKGIGKSLLSKMVQEFANLGFERLFLGCSVDPSTRSYGFYRHLGWRSTGTRDALNDEILEYFPRSSTDASN